MIIVKNGQLGKETMDALNILIAQKVPVKICNTIIKVIRRVNGILNDINSNKNDLINRHIERDSEGKPVFALDNEGKPLMNQVKIANEQAYKIEVNDFLNQEHEIDCDRIDVKDLGEDIKIEPMHLMNLEWFINLG